MQFVDPDLPARLSDLALYSSLVATGVVALNIAVVRLLNWIGFLRSRSRGPAETPVRPAPR